MSEKKIKARDWIVYASEDGGTTYKPIACLTSNELTSSNAPIDASSKCGNEFLTGDKLEQSISVEGFAITETGTPAKVSASKIYDLQIDKTVFKAKISKAVPVAGDITYTGDVFVSEFTESSADGELNNFTATLTVALPPMAQSVTV
jgi:hypothetical protein